MLYVKMVAGRAVEATNEYPGGRNGQLDSRYESRNDWRTMERAEQIAEELSQSTGTLFIATDAGPSIWPRYDVIEAPKVGDKVSVYFNGDSHPAGEIVKISRSLRRIETALGTVFYRKGKTGAWIHADHWSMIQGHEKHFNREF